MPLQKGVVWGGGVWGGLISNSSFVEATTVFQNDMHEGMPQRTAPSSTVLSTLACGGQNPWVDVAYSYSSLPTCQRDRSPPRPPISLSALVSLTLQSSTWRRVGLAMCGWI